MKQWKVLDTLKCTFIEESCIFILFVLLPLIVEDVSVGVIRAIKHLLYITVLWDEDGRCEIAMKV